MDFFEKKRRYDAVVTGFTGKMQRVKQGKDAARKCIVQLKVEVPISANIRKALDERMLPILDLIENAGDSDVALNSVDCIAEVTCIVKIFSKANYSKDSKPVIEKGGENCDEAKVRLTRIVGREGKPLMILVFTLNFDETLWAWGGRVLGEGDITIETMPFQPDLPFDGKKEDEDDKDAD